MRSSPAFRAVFAACFSTVAPNPMVALSYDAVQTADTRDTMPARDPAIGPFPTNQITSQPFSAPDGGAAGLKTTIGALQRTLTTLQQLQLHLKQAHWNVSGTLFYPLHTMLDRQYEDVSRYVDLCAERLLAIGASADGRPTTIAKTANLPEMPGGFLDDAQVLSWFTLAYKSAGDDLKRAIKETAVIDPTTAGLLQEIERGIGKFQWQMRAEFQSTTTDPNSGADLNDGRPVPLPAK